MSDSAINIRAIAHLARLELTGAEEQLLEAQLQRILGYVEQLQGVDVTGIEPTSHAAPRSNVLRADELRPSWTAEEALQNAPARSGDLFQVPRIIE